ncbi:MAG: tRNA (adenosine(37)-N6)-threonylcarbamoyltransferase complex transferase subunit TsaD [bacterium]|nr:tRNA (adenosine(37)-N6)-threonylcarbamoyltransferase complex transferase subunit TsaD [bacterium]
MKLVLGIETSCDETAVSIVGDGHKVLSNIVSSQIAKHAVYGGVVPELAAREHLNAMVPVTDQALAEAKVTIKDIDAVSVTNVPGLMPALLVGLNFARGLSLSNNIPLIGINHFVAHIYASFLNENFKLLSDINSFPILALVVSGGHTALVLINKDSSSKIIGTTIDDAAGEAMDKGAKLLNLGYPGGPIIDKLSKNGDRDKFKFPRSLTGTSGKAVSKENTFNFSFSGLKTSLLYHIEKNGGYKNFKDSLLYDTIASYQYAIVDVLCMKTIKAAKKFNSKSIVLCGGVAQNSLLREELNNRTPKNTNFILTPREYCGDNAAMIAGLGFHYLNNKESDLAIDASSRLPKFSTVPFVPNL